TREALRRQLLEVWDGRSPRKTVVFVTHSAEEAALLSDRVVVMATKPGRIHGVVELGLARSQRLTENPEFAESVRTITRTLREGWSGE
ncbi:MAG: ABC transporter ATP-binding protein, partial [Herbiconiux sp.]|nr:ABC transporter ATP-binding protein [Herbiconiux sp.]